MNDEYINTFKWLLSYLDMFPNVHYYKLIKVITSTYCALSTIFVLTTLQTGESCDVLVVFALP